MKTMALSREITLTIDNYNITLDKEIKIYEYDAINLCFTIQEYGIVMRDGKAHNRTMPVVALKAYMLIETPQGTDSVEATNIVRNKIMFSLGNKYSRFVGTGKMQIILKDFDGCRITLPEFNYEVKQSINTGWDDGSFDVLITEKEDTIITDELGRPVETTKISEFDEINEITPQTYTMVINEDGNKKMKLDTMMESISEMIEFDVEEIDRRIDEMIEVYDDEEVEVEFPSLHNEVERIKDEINEISESLDAKANKTDLTNSMIPKGNISYSSLPTTGNNVGDYYYCEDASKVGNYMWNGTQWFFAGTGNEGFNILNEKIDYTTSIVTDVVRYREQIDGSTGCVHTNIRGKKGDTICVNILSYTLDNFNYANLAIKRVGETTYTTIKDIDGKMAIRIGDTKYFVADSDFESLRLPCILTSNPKGIVTAEIYILNSSTLLNRVTKLETTTNYNVIAGKSISFNGDSICAGAGFTGGYGKIIADNNNMVYQNVAVSGGSIAEKTGTPYVICNGIENMNISDYCILEGGFNDYSYNIPLGTYSNSYVNVDENTLDRTTFSGAFEYMIIKALKKFTGKKIGFIAIHTVVNHSNLGLNAYIDRAIDICNKWSIPVLDLRKELGYSTLLGDDYNKMYFINAGNGGVGTLHPNEVGYKELYVPKIEKWLMQL